MSIIVGIDASRNRSGGAKIHLAGILGYGDPLRYDIRKIHVWSYQSLLDAIPDKPWLVKHHPAELEESLLKQIWWQRFRFPDEAKKAGCSIVLNTDASTVFRFRPSITMSRDMLSYEPGELERFDMDRARLRIKLRYYFQNRSFRLSDGVIFLTNYAARVIQGHCGKLSCVRIIPHGVGDEFKMTTISREWPGSDGKSINCLYVSNVALYKHQWVVVTAIAALRSRGYNLHLTLAGGGPGSGANRARYLLEKALKEHDPNRVFVKETGYVNHEELPSLLKEADLFIFASSCENMPNTLLEAMAVGIPIACSNRGPMPEVLEDGGVYFDPEDPESISSAIEKALKDKELRLSIAIQAKKISEKYSWVKCSGETMDFLKDLSLASKAAKSRPYQICSKCVMDTSDTKIVFNPDGVCDHCKTYFREILPNWYTGKSGRLKLEQITNEIKREGQGKDFDCIVGISGGTDSSYLTYVAKEMMGLRPLVFHVDTGWNSKESVNNIEVLIDKLGLELFTEVIDWEEMRDLQLAFFKSGVPHIDTPQDHAIFATMYNFAVKHNIKHILTGANLSTECIRNPIEWMYFQSDSTQLRDIHHRFGNIALTKFPTTSILWHKVYLPYIKGIKVVKPLNCITYVRDKAAKTLQERFDWHIYGEKHYESRFTRFYESYWLFKKFGFDVRRVKYSSLILTGQMTREEALEKLSDLPYEEEVIRNEIEFIAKKLEITIDELRGYLDAPNKSFRDYKSQWPIYAAGSKIMKMLGMELGGKR